MHSADRQMIINPAAYLITKRGETSLKTFPPLLVCFPKLFGKIQSCKSKFLFKEILEERIDFVGSQKTARDQVDRIANLGLFRSVK